MRTVSKATCQENTKALKRGRHPSFDAICRLLPASLLSLSLLSLSACFSNEVSPLGTASPTATSAGANAGNTASDGGTTSSDGTTTSSVTVKFVLANAIVASSSQTASSVSLFLDPTKTTPLGENLSQYCNVTAATANAQAKACNCEFTWDEINRTSDSLVPIKHKVSTAIATAQPNLVVCPMPAVYASEILDNTLIKITIVPRNGNPQTGKFEVKSINYTKAAVSQTGSFQDNEGRAFDNILRYTCFEQFRRGMSISNKTYALPNPTDGQKANVMFSTRFCLSKVSDDGSSPPTDCNPTPTGPENSAESYYHNLYIRDTNRGSVNMSNQRFTCPQVKENLYANGNVGSQIEFYPFDRTFALSLSSSADFPIGVEAFSKISSSNDKTPGPTSCLLQGQGAGGGGGAQANDSSLVSTCLGFAAQPESTGACPKFKDATGRTRYTYRLRRFLAIYPALYDTNGWLLPEAQANDTIYVLDRPVTPSSDSAATSPYTMRGPKPCPFAYFDAKGVVNSTPQQKNTPAYYATNYPGWFGVNPDNIQLPNQDTANSCSANMAVYNTDTNKFSIATINPANPAPELQRVFIRPIQPWAPHYEEDLDFKACAPEATPMIDPPLHFAKDPTSKNVSWCAEVYPTQNPYVNQIDSTGGNVKNHTSHAVKSAVGATCTPTNSSKYLSFPSSYSSTGWAMHDSSRTLTGDSTEKDVNCLGNGDGATGTCLYKNSQTCDRTVLNTHNQWEKFPLLAPAKEVENAIASDSTFGCIITYDAGGTKAGKKSPGGGCCGSAVKVITGSTGPTTGHLEPSADGSSGCKQPEY